MPEAFTIGSFLIPVRPAAVLASLFFAIWATGRIAAWVGAERRGMQKVMETSAWIGIAFARLGFVVFNWSAFVDAPWTAFYFWQPGYSPYAGVVGGTGFALFRLIRRPPGERRVSVQAIAGGFAAGCLFLGAVIATSIAFSSADVLRRGDPIPDFTLQSLDGEPVKLSSLRGKIVVLNFWATWCLPCRREMPLLDTIQDEYQERGVTIIGVNLSEPAELVRPFIESMNVDYPIWVDCPTSDPIYSRTSELFQRLGGVGLPTTYFIGPDRVLRDIRVGELNRGILQQGIESIMKRQR